VTLSDQDMDYLDKMGEALMAILNDAVKESTCFVYDDDMRQHEALIYQALLDDQKRVQPSVSCMSGFILYLERGFCGCVTHFSKRDIALDIRSQLAANAVLFTLLGHGFVKQHVPREWGDVVNIRWFTIEELPMSLVVAFKTLFESTKGLH
jgi:hypothetical protein